MQITVENKPTQSRLDALNVTKWPTWQKETSTFPWTFHEQEIAYILEGECVITPFGGAPVSFGKGDLVTFPAGLKASWEVKQPLHKHYQLDGNALSQAFRRIKAALFKSYNTCPETLMDIGLQGSSFNANLQHKHFHKN